MMNPEPMFGRILAPDPNDKRYGMDLVLPSEWPHAQKRMWTPGPIPDQRYGPPGFRNSCVGHGTRQFLTSTPKPRRDGPDGFEIYRRARLLDQWMENDNLDLGTSVRAGFMVLQELGYIGTYLWAWDPDTVAKWILRRGPAVIGTQWLTGMITPDSENYIHARGQVVGLHCTALVGADRRKRRFLLANSWGLPWGWDGKAWISFDDMGLLLEPGSDGECVVAIETRLTPPAPPVSAPPIPWPL